MGDDAVEVAAELGRAYRGVAARLPRPVPKDVEEMLGPLDAAMAASSLRDMSVFVRDTPHVRGGNPVTVSFFSEHPLDHILVALRANPTVLLTEPWVHDMLRHVLIALFLQPGAQRKVRHCERLAAGLPVVEALRDYRIAVAVPGCLEKCLDLLVFVCRVSRDLVNDRALFRILATPAAAHAGLRERIMNLLEVGEFFADTPLVEDLFAVLLNVVVRARGGYPNCDVVDFVERMLEENVELRTERVVQFTSQLWRTGWPAHLGRVVALLLDTTNVAFVVALEREGRLASLADAARAHTSDAWRAVHRRLRYLERRAEECTGHQRRHYTCPITLDFTTHPVAVSDGRVYERNAILHHFAVHGFVSPMTRQRVAPYVFPLYE